MYWGDGGEPRVRGQTLVDEVVIGLRYDSGESFVGPARVFLAPGRQRWRLSVLTDDGRVGAPFDAELQAGGRYLIEIDESDDNFEWSLIRLSDQSYRELYER